MYIINAVSLIRTFHLSEQNFEPINQRGSDKRGCTVKRQSLLHQAYKYQPCFHGTSLHLTELTDDISLCSYLIEHIYLSAFYKKIIIVMIKKQ